MNNYPVKIGILTILTLMLIGQNTFAHVPKTCPEIKDIQAMVLSKAIPSKSLAGGMFYTISASADSYNTPFNWTFTVSNISANNDMDALDKLTKTLSTLTLVSLNPERDNADDLGSTYTCRYSIKMDGFDDIVIMRSNEAWSW